MQTPTNRATILVAGTIVAAGAAWAGTVVLSPSAPSQMPDISSIETLAQQSKTPMAGETLEPVPVQVYTPAAAAAPTPAAAPMPVAQAIPPPSRIAPAPYRVEPSLSGPRREYRVIPAAGPSARTTASEDPVKNLALVGVTHDGTTGTAWLVDIVTMRRESAAIGEQAFGFTIRKVEDERVRLARGGREYWLNLGEKEIPVVTPVARGTSTESERAAAIAAFSNVGRRNQSASTEDNGNEERAEAVRRFMELRNRGGLQTDRSGRDRDDNDRETGGRDGRSGRDAVADNSRNRNSNDDRNSDNFDPRNRFRGPNGEYGGPYGGPYDGNYYYAPYAFGGNGFGPNGYGGNDGSNSQFGSTAPRSSVPTNPQTARRRGTNVSGSGTIPPNQGPAPFTNPQTQRRMGTNSGSAFGEETNNSNRRSGTNPGNPGSRSGPSR